MLYKIRVYEKGRKKVTIVMTTCNVLGIIEQDFGPLKLEDWDVFKYFSILLIRDVDTLIFFHYCNWHKNCSRFQFVTLRSFYKRNKVERYHIDCCYQYMYFIKENRDID